MAIKIGLKKRVKFAGDVLAALTNNAEWDLKTAAAFLDSIPDADSVEVVRCKDCKHYQYGVMFPDIKFCCRLKNSEGKTVRYNWSDNDFCSYGERKEKGDG